MNRLTSRQRKLVYLVALVVLFVPIVLLGMPASSQEQTGGMLARLRQEHDLGETTLGKVDPTSATMNLLLFGLRGLATDLLWLDAIEAKKVKDWGKLRATVDSIVMLQPHYLKVWTFQGWNLAYNVSAEWDKVEDRFYWVKEGTKFLMKGTERNAKYPELPFEVGRFIAQKIGHADERKQFRRFFRNDPDVERWNGGPDLEINPDQTDNYLAARTWFLRANEREERYPTKMMARVLFRGFAPKTLIDYAMARQKDGLFGETTREAWRTAFNEWTRKYGREVFQTLKCKIVLEWTEEDVKRLARESDVDEATVRTWIARYQNMTRYRYWRNLARAEQEPETAEAHRELHRGRTLFQESRLPEAKAALERGMALFADVLRKNPELVDEDDFIEEGMMSVLLWRAIHELTGQEIPEDFPLKAFWVRHQNRLPMILDQFNREFRIQ